MKIYNTDMGKENENMDLNELNSWLETDEGKQWGEQFKAPLLKNRDLLLSELKTANGRLSEAEQRNAQTENDLSSEKAVVSKLLIDHELHRLLNNAHVFLTLIPDVANSLRNAYGITVKASGNDRTAMGKLRDKEGSETEAALEAIVKAWAALPESKSIIRNVNSGGGATGGGFISSAYAPQSLSKLSGPALASMSDTEFRDRRNSEIMQGSFN